MLYVRYCSLISFANITSYKQQGEGLSRKLPVHKTTHYKSVQCIDKEPVSINLHTYISKLDPIIVNDM